MELTWLEDFAALVELANFSRAAEARNLTQPAFSRRIRALEDWVGAPLFDRSTTPVRLTEAGQSFLPTADEVVRRLALGREEAREAARRAAGSLTFAGTHALSLTFFPGWLRGLEARLSLGSVRLISDSMRACEEVMAQGQAQFLLCHDHPAAPGRLDPRQFRGVTVGQDVLVPVAAPALAHLLDRAGQGGVPALAYDEDSGMSRIVGASLKAHGRQVRLDPVFTSHLAGVLHSMSRDGRGVAWLPLSLVAEDLAAGRLARAGGEDWDIPVAIRLLRPRSRQSPAAEALWAEVDCEGAGG